MRSSPFSLPSCVIQIKALASIYPNILRGSAAAIYLGSKCCVWQRCLISRRCLIGARERGPDRRHSRAPRPAPRGDKYARQFLIGGGVTLINITIHADDDDGGARCSSRRHKKSPTPLVFFS